MFSSLQVVLLVGGLGTRLSSQLGDLPKPMVNVGGCCFLERQLLHLRENGIRNVILAVSHRREAIQNRFGDGSSLGLTIAYSVETQRLGTAGALRNALPLLGGEEVLLLNGDSFAEVNYEALLRFHRKRGAKLTITAVHQPDCSDYGRLRISEGRVQKFVEKQQSDSSPGYINAGVYIFRHDLIEELSPGVVQSLENEVFPSLIDRGEPIYAHCVTGYFADIGTPQRLQQFRDDFLRGVVPLRGANLNEKRMSVTTTSQTRC
jgi:NDP-sugar pyrophosphorylase family protein